MGAAGAALKARGGESAKAGWEKWRVLMERASLEGGHWLILTAGLKPGAFLEVREK